MPKTSHEAKAWWSKLSAEEKKQVKKWIKENPKEEDGWDDTWSDIEWAHTECPCGIFTGKYGHFL